MLTHTAAHTRRALRTFFGTVRLAGLRIESDGRAGNGYTHWRLVADLADDRSGRWSVTLAVRGDLRRGRTTTFPTLDTALAFLLHHRGDR